MKLSSEKVLELSNLRSQIKELQAKEKELSEKIKSTMEEEQIEEFAPKGCQLKFVLNKYVSSRPSWKDYWEKVAKKYYGSKWKKEQQRLIRESESEVVSLTIVPN